MDSEVCARVSVTEDGFPFIPSPTFRTEKGTPYLRAPGVHVIGKPSVSLGSVREFLAASIQPSIFHST